MNGGGGGLHMQPYVCDYLNGAPSFLLTSPISHLLNPADFTPARCSCSRHNFRFLRVLPPGLWSTCLLQAVDHGPETLHLLRVLPPGLWSTCLLQAADHGPETLHLLRVLPPGLWSTGLSRAADEGPKTRDTTLAASLAAQPVEHRPVTGSGPRTCHTTLAVVSLRGPRSKSTSRTGSQE